MTIPARDSVYVTDRTHFLRVLETQIAKLRANPGNRLFVVQGLRELARLTPGCLEASRVVGDLVFHQMCCILQHLWQPAIATLLADADEFDVYRVADGLEGALPLEVRDPFSCPATW
ncbi:hypothetical protein N7530_011166 [Penicillium desertorum]|uniref:Uncharacterized protein n=1 Tax=Penicillium desertorum TaxID=1303715 RepID=A0A9W9WGQ1_9EURO|nr:hypothetical protein N7530_011166 [Penicillium desertorum]